MNPVATLLTWPMISAENALKAAWAVYAAVAVVALAIGLATFAGLHGFAMQGVALHGDAWFAASLLGLLGAWRVRSVQSRLSSRRRVAPIWPFAVVALLGLFTNAIYGLMLVIALFEVLQARYVLDLAPVARD